MIKRKIAILTQPLHTNYGGLLQAYALQKVLRDMGHEVVTDKRPQTFAPFYRQLLSIAKRFILKYILCRKGIETIFPYFQTKEDYVVISQHTERFIDQHIQTVDLFQGKKRPTEDMINAFDAYVVGSDQVWRPMYSSFLPNYFLDFTKGKSCKRIGYAISFGVSDWELTSKQTILCKHLVKQFDAISMREDSAVLLCKTYLDADAVHVLDPTMLLDKKDYISLVEQAEEPVSSGNLMVYILDRSNEKIAILNQVVSTLHLRPFDVMPIEKLSSKTKHKLSACTFPSVTQWLRGFMDAEYVVTDSFHGSVFAIIFKKPFIAIGNNERGLARFNALFRYFNLENRLVLTQSELTIKLIKEPIDFDFVSKMQREGLKKSKDFLMKNI